MAIRRKKLTEQELAAFCRQLHMVITAGLPAYQGISILMDDTDDIATLGLLQSLYAPMQEGYPLSYALRQTELFPSYMIEMIELGENTGRLEEVLLSLNFYYEKNSAITDSIRHAVTYPVIMIVMMLAVITVLILKVLPIFSKIYEGLGTEITGFGATLIGISNFLNRYLLLFVLIVAAVIVLLLLSFCTRRGRQLYQRYRLPMQIASGRFANCMYLILASGLDTDQGLDFAARLIDNPYMAARIDHARDMIAQGIPFSRALFGAHIFSKAYSSWVSIGELTGGMDDTMKYICDSYEEDTNETIAHYIGMIEPSLVIALSVIIGLILISFMLPLLAIMASIG